MTIWRPAAAIRVKVLGLVWRADALLAAEVETDDGRVKGLRPLGGSIEFGETRETALRREFREELGCDLTISGAWIALENIYVHEGATGHEIIFAANVALHDPSIYARDVVRFTEDTGESCTARWVSPSALPGGVELYPSGLASLLQAEREQ